MGHLCGSIGPVSSVCRDVWCQCDNAISCTPVLSHDAADRRVIPKKQGIHKYFEYFKLDYRIIYSQSVYSLDLHAFFF